MNELRVFGWTLKQIAFAKRRHEIIAGINLQPELKNLLQIKKWWHDIGYEEPLSTIFESVIPELDMDWSSKVFCDALMRGRHDSI